MTGAIIFVGAVLYIAALGIESKLDDVKTEVSNLNDTLKRIADALEEAANEQ